MHQLNTDLALANLITISNVWLLTDKRGRRFLIDTGDQSERLQLARSLSKAGIVKPGDLTAVLLTHWHRDHAGNAAWVRRKFQCPVICHPHDAGYLSGLVTPPPFAARPLSLFHKVSCSMQDWLPAHSPVDDVYQVGHWRWGFEVIPVPGHTDGSVMLYHKPSRTLFSGDAILTGIPPFRLWEAPRLADPGFTPQVDLCRETTREFIRSMPPIDRVCAGHGPLIDQNVHAKLNGLLVEPEKLTVRGLLEKGAAYLPDFVSRMMPHRS